MTFAQEVNKKMIEHIKEKEAEVGITLTPYRLKVLEEYKERVETVKQLISNKFSEGHVEESFYISSQGTDVVDMIVEYLKKEGFEIDTQTNSDYEMITVRIGWENVK